MARFEIADVDGATLGAAAGADVFFELGMMYASGRSVPVDLVSAHKWFNIASMRGNQDAIRLRREIAAEMSDAEIGAAQRAARDWLKANDAAAAVLSLREAVRLAPKNPQAHYQLALALERTGAHEEARTHLEEARRLAPDLVPRDAR